MKFNIGDKVRVIKAYGCASVGDEGIIKALPGENGFCGLPYNGYGQWVDGDDFEVINESEPPRKIVITREGKTTTAKLYDGKEITKTAEAKCSPDDKFDFAAGAKLAFERLMGEEKKEPPKFDKSMLTTGRIGYMSNGQGWFVVVNGNLVYENGGYDVIAKIDENGDFRSWGVECIVDARSFSIAKIRLPKGENIVWMRPGFDPKKAV